MGYLGATLIHVFAHAHGRSGRVTQRCHNSPHWKRGYWVWVTSRTGRAWRVLGDFEKVSELRLDTGRVEMRPASEKDGWLSLARGNLCGGYHTCWGRGRWKSQYRKIVPLSPLNSTVIKRFVPEQRSRKCFSNFEIPMFYLYGHSMYVSHIAMVMVQKEEKREKKRKKE